MSNGSKKLTTVQLEENLLQEFKFTCVKYKFSFQKLASRAIFLYINDKEFRDLIHQQLDTKVKEK
jgi:hypothetical protein